MPSCRCPTPDFLVPGWKLSDYPQFVLLTFDDSLSAKQLSSLDSLNFLLNNPKLKDKKGCSPKVTYYVRQLETDFTVLNFIDKVGEINLHTFSHSTNTATKLQTWRAEYLTEYKAVTQLAGVKPRGSRAPFLQTNDNYFETLRSMDFLYDSSMIYSKKGSKFPWPFTLDFPVPEKEIFCVFGMCPGKPFPGLWEFPMSNLDYDVVGNVMDPKFDLSQAKTYMDKIKANFLDSYNSNRAPRGVYWNWRYLLGTDQSKINFLVEFYTWIATLDNVVFATESEVIAWMQKPQKFTSMKANCLRTRATIDNTCKKKTCFYQEQSFEICGETCPSAYPGLNSRTLKPNDWTLDPKKVQTNKDLTHWIGNKDSRIFAWGDNANNKMLMCVSGHFEHSSVIPAKSALISMKICSKLVDKKDPVYGIWGAPAGYFSNNKDSDDDDDFVIKYQVNGLMVTKGVPGLNVEGFCLKAKDLSSYNKWLDSVKKFTSGSVKSLDLVSFGVDWYPRDLTCEIGNCKVWCGDGICSKEELAANACPFDCEKSYKC